MMDAIWLHLVQSTLFAALLVALYWCLPPRAATIRYALLLAALVKFAIPIAPLVDAGRQIGELPSMHASLPAKLPAFPADLYSALTAPTKLPLATHHPALQLVLLAFWLGGAAALLLLWMRRLHSRPNAIEESAATGQPGFEEIIQRLPIRQKVRICFSAAPDLCLRGIWRPLIQVPQLMTSEWSAGERDAVLLHELAHIYRRDNFWSAAAHIVACIFWFHPLLWWLERRLTGERERAVDQMVVDCGADRNAYVAGILKLCRYQLRPSVAGTSGVGGSDLKQRLEWIMSCPKRKFNFRAARALMAASGTVILALPLIIGFSQHVSGTPANDSKSCRAGESYPVGTAVRMGSSVKECSHGSWVPTKKPATVVIKAPPPFTCQPASSPQADLCACEGRGIFSLGAIVQGSGGGLRCDSFKLGRFSTWRALTAEESAHFTPKMTNKFIVPSSPVKSAAHRC